MEGLERDTAQHKHLEHLREWMMSGGVVSVCVCVFVLWVWGGGACVVHAYARHVPTHSLWVVGRPPGACMAMLFGVPIPRHAVHERRCSANMPPSTWHTAHTRTCSTRSHAPAHPPSHPPCKVQSTGTRTHLRHHGVPGLHADVLKVLLKVAPAVQLLQLPRVIGLAVA